MNIKAMFITTKTIDCANHVRAWDSCASVPAEHVTYDHGSLPLDQMFLAEARRVKPDVIFYIGAAKARGNPHWSTLKELRSIAPSINICSDAADRPWHSVLAGLKTRGCFTTQVAIDGAKHSPADLATLTPVDHRPFDVEVDRDIRFGFSGNLGRHNARSEIVNALRWFGGLAVRERTESGTYEDHARFMKRCRVLLNLSFTGSGAGHHIKGRVLEAGWAGCALLEPRGSPIGEWFPADCFMQFGDPPEAAAIVAGLDDATIERMGRRLGEEVRTRYSAAMIYRTMLNRVPGYGRGAIKGAIGVVPAQQG